jgi:hypothetical protein
LLIADPGTEKDPKPVLIGSLPPAEQNSILERLKKTKCYGIAGGVTTTVVKTEGLCGKVDEVVPHSGLGQSFLASKAGFEWDEKTWVGVVTRDTSALRISMNGVAAKSGLISTARLLVIPARSPVFGYGLYLHASVTEAEAKKAVAVFTAITAPSKAQIVALDLGSKFNFAVPSQAQLQQVAAAIGVTLGKEN